MTSAKQAIWGAWSKGLELDPLVMPSEWAETHRILPEGVSVRAGRWKNRNAPFLREIMDRMSPQDPARRITFMKSAQVGGSALAENVLGWIIDVAPGPTLVVHPTREAALDWNAEKLDPTIQATTRLNRKVSEVVSRGREGSTMRRKRFPGGSIVLTGANSAAGLRQKSIKTVIRDDFDEWPHDVGGQGDPAKMADARQKSYERSGQAKTLDISTPTLEISSRIWKQWQAGTQGEYEVPCPHCRTLQTLEWGTKDKPYEPHWVKFNPTPPHQAHFICAACGKPIYQHHLGEILQEENGARWTHRALESGRDWSYRINAFYSQLESWDSIVKEFLEINGDVELLKTFVNLSLGLPFRGGAEGVKAEILHKRVEDYKLGACPMGVLQIALGSDVQHDGIYYEVVGWGRDRQSWSLDFGFLEGDTGTIDGAPWRNLRELRRKTFRDRLGNERPIDAAGVDASYLTDVVAEFCRKNAGFYPLRGVAGQHAPLWAGRAVAREWTERGRKRRKGAKAFEVGTWAAKERLFGALRVDRQPEQIGFPPSYCHFSQAHTLEFFEQLTAEVFIRAKHRKTGKVTLGWHQTSTQNHYLDCRVYAMAMAEKLGQTRNSDADWDALQRKWLNAAEPSQRGLFDGPSGVANALRAPASPVAPPPPAPPTAQPTPTRIIEL